jgi:DNA-binding transcriptional LysR family regulator
LAAVAPATIIRIGTASTISPRLIEAVVSVCLSREDLRLEIVERKPSELASLLDRGRVDLLLGPAMTGWHLRKIDLFTESYLLAMSTNHRLAKQDIITIEQMIDEPMLVRRQCEALPVVSQFFTARGIRPFMAARSTNEEWIAGYVRTGLGTTVMPQSLARQGIVLKPLAGLDIKRSIALSFDPAGEARLARSGVIHDILDRIGTSDV